jgi:hypothetical protein
MATDEPTERTEPGDTHTVLHRMRTGPAVIGDNQFLPGYCLLIYDGDADHLTDLPRGKRAAFLLDLSLLGEAVAGACAAADPSFRRLNYSVLGNPGITCTDTSTPGTTGNPSRSGPARPGCTATGCGTRRPAAGPGDRLRDPATRLGPQHDNLRREITSRLRAVTADAYGTALTLPAR